MSMPMPVSTMPSSMPCRPCPALRIQPQPQPGPVESTPPACSRESSDPPYCLTFSVFLPSLASLHCTTRHFTSQHSKPSPTLDRCTRTKSPPAEFQCTSCLVFHHQAACFLSDRKDPLPSISK
ncbi:hypothetical protein DL95DRAFT_92038 [Leptodontidium sp. 2 PMI_412]|nr:hypothetical protein DL95DRAFT_92038 [Leptodontidium sp. 2 PMI_412]